MRVHLVGGGRTFALLALIIAALLIAGAAAQARTIYVNVNAGPANTGTSWDAAYTSLQTALQEAKSGDDILIAAGVYYPGKTQTSTFTLPSDIALYGGYSANGGSRDVAANTTVLSGDVDHATSPDTTDANGVTTAIQGSNAYHVVTIQTATSVVFDGITVCGGDAIGTSEVDQMGGGMLIGDSNVTVNDCTFTGNTAYGGGGIAILSDGETAYSPLVENCMFSGNHAVYTGGGMCNIESSATVTDCTFTNNDVHADSSSASFAGGGGMTNIAISAPSLPALSPTVTGCTFSSNYATADSVVGGGGGMLNIVISSDQLTAQAAGHPLGGNSVSPLGLNFQSLRSDGVLPAGLSPLVVNCVFSANYVACSGQNSGALGGGMLNMATSPTVTDCTFAGNLVTPTDNSSGASGGGMCNFQSSSTLINCTFYQNSASGGSAAYGGAIANEDSPTTLTYCTLTFNAASGSGSQGGGLWVRNDSTSAVTTLGATIVAGNDVSTGGTGPDIYGAVTSNGYNLVGETSGTSGFTSTDLTNVDPKLGPLADNGSPVETCALLPGSPAIDRVPTDQFPTITKDARGVRRPQGSACDIGAFEYKPSVGDVNGDGVINVLDVRLCQQIALGVIQGTPRERQQADVDGNGQVTLADARLLAEYVAGLISAFP